MVDRFSGVSMTVRVRVWDLPTRLFHWLLVTALIALIVTANVGGWWMDWHMRIGIFVLSLLIFRIFWGVFGGTWSRFHRFIFSPRSLIAYLQGQSPMMHRVGHTPLGALSVFALLLALVCQVTSGLMTDDAIFFAGPLVPVASDRMIEWASRYHKDIGQFVVLGLVILHVVALVVYKLFFKQALVAAMIHGDKSLPEQAPASADGWHVWLQAALLYAMACALTYLLVSWGTR